MLPAFGGPTEIRELPVPPLEDDALLVEVEAATLCGTDVHIADGDLAGPGFAQVPLVPGHEIVGRVVAPDGTGGPTRSAVRCGRATGSPGPTPGATGATGARSPSSRRCARTG